MPDSFNFLQNKYSKWYANIIANAVSRDLSDYVEKHHIIPKSLGGSNSKENIASLTAREHFICHWLLTKMVINTDHKYKMWNAFSCMLYRERPGQERYKVNSKTFEIIKRAGAVIKSKKFSGKNNPMYGIRGEAHHAFGKTWTDEHRKNASESHKGQIRTLESRLKQSESTKGRKQTEEHIAKRIKFGRLQKEESKNKIRQSILSMPKHTCEHCGFTTTKGNYKRWHGVNCKHHQGEIKFQD